jgi:hypothetical protein
VLGVIGRSAGRGVRVKAVCEELGLGGEPKHVEALRGKLKRLARRGWLIEPSPGVFVLAQGVGSAAGG